MPVVVKIDPRRPEKKIIENAALVIRRGGLVVFPTETFYGLGANALDGRAVKKIFRVKGRPENKPLIVLIANKKDLRRLASYIPPVAYKLINKFWPGPLTLIFKRKKIIPKEVTAGGSTIAIRLSSHPVALALVRAAGVPITAPSANLSGRPPHQTIRGALKELGKHKEIGLFLDGGTTPLGKPSTILDLTKKPPKILRTGSITKKELLRFIGSLFYPK